MHPSRALMLTYGHHPSTFPQWMLWFERWIPNHGGDLDLGEMFHNFPLDIELCPYCEIDMSPYFDEAKSWERWVRLMGLRPSPYCSIKGFQLSLESVLGNHTDPENIFHWTEVIRMQLQARWQSPSLPTSTTLGPWDARNTTAGEFYIMLHRN